MSTHVPGFQAFYRFLHHFVLAELATSSIWVKMDKKVKDDLPCCTLQSGVEIYRLDYSYFIIDVPYHQIWGRLIKFR